VCQTLSPIKEGQGTNEDDGIIDDEKMDICGEPRPTKQPLDEQKFRESASPKPESQLEHPVIRESDQPEDPSSRNDCAIDEENAEISTPHDPSPPPAQSHVSFSDIQEFKVASTTPEKPPAPSRRVTFSDETRVVVAPARSTTSRSVSSPVSKRDNRPVYTSVSKHARQGNDENERSHPKKPRADYTTRIDLTSATAHYRFPDQATVLLTNSFDKWSNFCLCIDRGGTLELLDSTRHGCAQMGTIYKRDWIPEGSKIGAMNGAWINPGGLALSHTDSRANNPSGTQITIVDYRDVNLERKPVITHLRNTPHKRMISAIVPTWITPDKRAFVTGCITCFDLANVQRWRAAFSYGTCRRRLLQPAHS
jgi:hypothetical protein